MSLRERLDTLSRGELFGVIAVILVTLGAVALWYSRSLPKPIQVAETPVASVAAAGPSGGASPSVTVAPDVVIVDVTGWVRRPGVYRFASGDRVIDAVDRAGGARDGADLTLLNLAAPLVDGQQILVPKEGATVPAGGGSVGTNGVGGTALVNINTADATTLETLNGIGESLAAAIIQYRTEHGSFTSVDQLDEVSGIGPTTLEELRPFVTV